MPIMPDWLLPAYQAARDLGERTLSRITLHNLGDVTWTCDLLCVHGELSAHAATPMEAVQEVERQWDASGWQPEAMPDEVMEDDGIPPLPLRGTRRAAPPGPPIPPPRWSQIPLARWVHPLLLFSHDRTPCTSCYTKVVLVRDDEGLPRCPRCGAVQGGITV